jgi:ABC-type multidrug transport system fused ATPase/permease subunit
MSFRDNIRLGNVNATDAEVEEAAKAGIYQISLTKFFLFFGGISVYSLIPSG